ncbi:Phage integrase family protein [Roseomonas rosea]|uniref:Phage integrase family protein n=1 Tax=Muricoccus roseus TaxID=198092 RepID=A0A1M6LA45_9PROT|nr:tyrosine-type recombinase/integrase [Roseomonas rosea]SHJ68078.1 Phage integrase family protein [Roseomonas rosea]
MARPLPAPLLQTASPDSSPRLWPHVELVRKPDGRQYAYYRRNGRRIPLPLPLGSNAFQVAYEKARREAEGLRDAPGRYSVQAAVTAFLGSVDFGKLASPTQRDYRRTLDLFRGSFGDLLLPALDEVWIDQLREAHGEDPDGWNRLRSRMIAVVDLFRRRNPGVMADNPWKTARNLPVVRGNQNRRWPLEPVLVPVFRAATPEFRALLTGYLLTAQRGGDVTSWRPEAYDPEAKTLEFVQAKTANRPQPKRLLLYVPPRLQRAFDSVHGRHPERLFVTPRGVAWTRSNAEETLRTLLKNLGLERYTLHGLRRTGPSALKLLGFENRAIRELTGHDNDGNLEIYLDDVDGHLLARQAQEALDDRFGPLLDAIEAEGANSRRFSGLTGRAAAKARRDSALPTGLPTANSSGESPGKG